MADLSDTTSLSGSRSAGGLAVPVEKGRLANTALARLIRKNEAADAAVDRMAENPGWDPAIAEATIPIRMEIVQARPVDFTDLRRKATFAFEMAGADLEGTIAEDLASGSAYDRTAIYAFLRDFVRMFGTTSRSH